ncbi:MAG: HD domain-containing protein [Deltaproteobacteria bacterium]|jgi:phosphoribosyl 1,2-cyclic phosphodiesterase|nr:HD domain-containing protein [Deltaproteobacteria bacterium]
MKIILRGVRGGIAAPGPEMSRYGSNTACMEIRTAGGELIFLDAGTGLRKAGECLPESGESHIFISHGHADHIVGLWFFKPLHSPGWATHLYLPDGLESLPDWFHRCGFFPVPFERLEGQVIRHTVKTGESLGIGSGDGRVLVDSFAAKHPGGGLGYRLRADGAILLYTGDYEITGDPEAKRAAAELLRGADVAMVDAQYTRKDYQPGFGHSAWEDWDEAAALAGVPHLVLSHHDPARSDVDLDELAGVLSGLRGQERRTLVGREGLCFTLGGASGTVVKETGEIVETAEAVGTSPSQVMEEETLATASARRESEDRLFAFLEELSGYRSESVLLDRILSKARELAHADAGTIFLTEGNSLVFAYTHNDSLFPANEAHRHAYAAMRIPISEASIAGYAAATGRPLNLPDVRALPPGVPYHFNDAFDRKTGFTTRSVLALPFLDKGGGPLGVLQLINCLNPDKTPRPFSADMERDIRVLAREVSGILKCGAAEKNGMYGILRMTAVHDPSETGPHAERVGSIAAELYHVWASRQGRGLDAIYREKGRLRIASMLHDIGKVGVSDLVLKKPGKLTEEEFAIMRSHTALGATILSSDTGDIAPLARDIALHHHQKWNGKGYAGSTDAGRLAGEAIPLGARIAAIADVFDALVSPRCYKKPWTFEEALALLRREAGEHFDPALVESLAEISDLLHPIYERFPDKEHGGA